MSTKTLFLLFFLFVALAVYVDSFEVEEVELPEDEEETQYELLCREAIQLSANISSKLKCRYVHKNVPFLLIAPLKEEEAYLKPKIVLFHDVLYSNEITIMENLAQSQLLPATIENEDNEDERDEEIRLSKVAWLEESAHPALVTLRQRVSDMTSLSMESAESFQVCHYDIGGFYLPHFDYLEMNDVSEGGATVFPELDVALWPKKGSAAFWYNLHTSGAPDVCAEHGACPVLLGSKWIATLWIHEKGQELRRLCDPADAWTTQTPLHECVAK